MNINKNTKRTLAISEVGTMLSKIPLKFRHLLGLVASISLALSSVAGFAQDDDSGPTLGGPLEAKVVGDRLLVRVELQTEVWIKDTHVIIDFDMPFAMAINYPVIRDLRFGEGETTLKVLNENFRMEIPRAGIIDERSLGSPQMTAEITSRYDKELDQIDIVAIVGWPALRQFGMTLDIQEGTLFLHPEDELDASEVQASAEEFVQGVEIVGGSVFIPVNYNGGQRGFMKYRTAGYHTVLNRELLDNREAGVVDEAYFGAGQTMKLSDMAAFYPQDLYQKWWDEYAEAKKTENEIREVLQERGEIFPEEFAVQQPDQPSSDVLLVSGLSVLSGYRIVLDQNQGFIGLSRTVNSNYSEADHQFYMAAAAEDEDKLFQYLEDNPEDRNVEEAVSDLFDLGLESGASAERLLSAIQYGLDAASERRQFTYIAGFVFQLASSQESMDQHADVLIAVGERAMEFVGRSDSPKFRQQVQMFLGDRYLARNDAQKAWQYFLAAAFNSDPDLEAFSRYDLGRAYEALGRDRRAYVNYRKALTVGLPPDRAQNASEALNRLRPRLDPNDEILLEETPIESVESEST